MRSTKAHTNSSRGFDMVSLVAVGSISSTRAHTNSSRGFDMVSLVAVGRKRHQQHQGTYQ